MSHVADHHDEHDDAHEPHEAHDAHDEPPSDEPTTPRWLTALGGGLFLLLALGWLASRPGEPTLSELRPAPSAAAAEAPAPAPAPEPEPPAPVVVPPTPAPLPVPVPAGHITGKAGPKGAKGAPKGKK